MLGVQPAPGPVVQRHLEVGAGHRPGVGRLVDRAREALILAHPQVGQGQRQGDRGEDRRGEGDRREEPPGARRAVGEHDHREDDPDREGQLEADVETADHLDRGERPEADRRPPGLVAQQQQQRQHGPGGPGVRELVEVPDMVEAVGQEGVGQPRQEPDRAIPGQVGDERAHPGPRQDEGAEEQEVVGEDGIAGQDENRRADDRGRDVRVGVGEGVVEREEDVGVVEPGRIGGEGVLHPAHDPDLQRRVPLGRQGIGQPRGVGPGHHDRRQDIAQRDQRPEARGGSCQRGARKAVRG